MKHFLQLFHTVRYLKLIQIYYRGFYLLRRRIRKLLAFQYPFSIDSQAYQLILIPSIRAYSSKNKNTFEFLNISHSFKDQINWNDSRYGKLWTYNLTYFDYLFQENMTVNEGLTIIHDFIANAENIKEGLEPFPISLRGINWIKFLTYHQLSNTQINNSLYAQYKILMDNIEYHLLGNHLLENAFSLLFAAYFYQNENFYNTAKKIFAAELNEQILDDGAHFELSPMYHQIMLYRLLDCINLVKNNNFHNHELLVFLSSKAQLMLGWLNRICYADGSIPLFNDSTNHIAPHTNELNSYAKRLGIESIQKPLGISGYRTFQSNHYKCIIDIGAIGPDYIPGHSHADTFSFELALKDQPFIVDTGLSTYERGIRRDIERSTCSHNTVEIMNLDSSEVWSNFRVAKRAKIIHQSETANIITATHNGYKSLGINHHRLWKFETKKVTIEDMLNKKHDAVARLHFHPQVTEEMLQKHIVIIGDHSKVLREYNYAPSFNHLKKALVLEISFNTSLVTEIRL